MSPDVIPVPSGGIAACPVCRGPLGLADRELWCDNGHRFDRSREGFVNLLRVGHSRKAVIGDDADMVAGPIAIAVDMSEPGNDAPELASAPPA